MIYRTKILGLSFYLPAFFSWSLMAADAPATQPAQPNQTAPHPATPGQNSAIPFLPQAAFISIQPGQTDINVKYWSYDSTKIGGQTLDEVFKQREEDKQWYRGIVEQVNQSLKALSKQALVDQGGIADLATQANASGKDFPSAESFSIAQRKLNNALKAFEIELESIATTTDASAPSRLKIVRAAETQQPLEEIPQTNNINFKPLVDFARGKIKEITDALNSLDFLVDLPNGNPHHVEAGKVLADKIPFQWTESQITAKNALIKKYRNYGEADRRELDTWFLYRLQKYRTFIDLYGTQERYRSFASWTWSELIASLKELMDVGFAENYLLAKFSARQGVVQVDWKPRWFHVDKFFNKTKTVADFGDRAAFTDAEIDPTYKSIFNALSVMNERKEALTQSGRASQAQIEGMMKFVEAEDDLSVKVLTAGNTSVLAQANSLITYLVGNRNLALALWAELKQMAGLVYGEKLVTQPGGHELMVKRFGQLYQSNDADRAYWKPLFDQLSGKTEQGKYRSGPGVGGAGDFNTAFKSAQLFLKKKSYLIEVANQIESTLEETMPDKTKQIDDDFEKGFEPTKK